LRFILVDEILAMTPGKTIRATKFVAPDEDYFRDHFPGFPVVPGVLITEMMAQTAGKCLDAESPDRGRSMLARIDSARFSDWVLPGSTAIISAEIRTSRPQFATAKCQVEVQSRIVATAELFFAFVPRHRFAADLRDEVLESYLSKTPPSDPPPATGTPHAH
jgi:3-hydroxyacyl-[acyl-carrier-protein] dehydratase